MRFQGATKEILRYKICAAGENSVVSERYKEDFTKGLELVVYSRFSVV